MAASSSITLLNTMEWAKKLNFGRRSALGNSLEPALTSGNTILQTIVGAPFEWRWNRVVTGFLTVAGQQDYVLTNHAVNAQVALGWNTIDTHGTSQVVTIAGTTGATSPTWSTAPGGTTTDGTATWKSSGTIGLPVAQNYSLAWIETVSVQDAGKWFEIESKLRLASDSSQARPRFISAQGDDGLGNITFRLMPVPDKVYPVALTLQQKPPIFLSVNQSWAPIPDEYSHIFNWGFLSLMWLFSDDARFALANQKFVSALLGANEGLTETQINIFLSNWQTITGMPMWNMTASQQGTQSRGV